MTSNIIYNVFCIYLNSGIFCFYILINLGHKYSKRILKHYLNKVVYEFNKFESNFFIEKKKKFFLLVRKIMFADF